MIEMSDLSAIAGLITRGNFREAAEQLNDVYYFMLKKDSGFFQHIPVDKLTSTLLQDHNYTHDHLEILAELFNAEAELQGAQGRQADAVTYFEKAWTLLDFVDKANKTYSAERLEKMSRIRDRISTIRDEQIQ
jgi:tetratricopeptide (TPR) repeat protein